MKAIKRTVAALLATLMLATSTSFTLAAENYSEEEAIAVAKVNAAGIMTGTDNGFEPSKTLTRAEAAAIMVRMKGISESSVKAAAGTTLFTDVAASHWASGYINTASALGIIKGVSAKEFAPDRTVTIAEFETMAIRALGAGTLVDAQGTWPVNYVNFANEEGISEGIYNVYTAEASRLNAATIVANTLEAPIWQKTKATTSNEVTWEKASTTGSYTYTDAVAGTAESTTYETYKTILSEILKISVVKNVTCSSVSNIEHLFNNIDVVDNFDLSSIRVGNVYDYWMNDDNEILGLWVAENDNLTKVEFTQFVKVTDPSANNIGKVTLLVNGKEKEYNYDETATGYTTVISYNEDDTKELFAAPFAAKDKNMFGYAYVNGNKLIRLYAEKYETYGIVDEVKAKSIKLDTSIDSAFTTANTIKIDEEDYDYFFTKDGKGISVKDIKEDDAIAFYIANGGKKYVGKVLTDSIEGKVTAKSSTSVNVSIDKVKYDVENASLLGQFKNDQEVEAYLAEDGKIAMFKEIEDAASDVAVVKSFRVKTPEYTDGAHSFEVKLFLTDGTTSDLLKIDLEDTYEQFEDESSADAIKEVLGSALTAGTDTINGMTTIAAGVPEASEFLIVATDKYYGVDTHEFYSSKELAGQAIVYDELGDEDGDGEGKAICYEISGSRLSIVPVDASDKEFVTLTSAENLVVKSNTAYVTYDDGTHDYNYEVTDKTVFIKLKQDEVYSVKAEIVSLDSLDSTPLPVGSVLADVDWDDLTVGVVVFATDSTVNRTSETNFNYVIDYSTGTKSKSITVINTKGEKETYVADINDDGYDLMKASLVGKLVDLTVIDEKVTDIDELEGTTPIVSDGEDDEIVYETTAGAAGFKFNRSRSMFDLVDATEVKVAGTPSYVLANDVIVLKVTKSFADLTKADFKLASIDDIEDFDKDEVGEDDEDNDYVVQVITYTNDASENDTEVVAIVYALASDFNAIP